MKINALNSNLSFKRAYTSKEKKEFEQVEKAARKELGLDKTSATIFDFNVPSSNLNTGIGTTFSDDAQKLVSMLKTMNGINSIQVGPQGEISNVVRSPYSGTNFSLGRHLIDLEKLKEDRYGNLLSKDDYKASYFNRVESEDFVDYDNVFAKDGQDHVLRIAYSRFVELSKTSPLKKEFETFKDENSYWLEKDALFEAAAHENNSEDIREWNKRDQNIFATKEGDRERIEQLKKVNDEHGNNIVDYEEFVQFIASKQQQESKEKFNSQGVEIYGDSQIGVSQKDFWAHRTAFAKDQEFGCSIGDGKFSCWSPALDFNKIDSDAGEFLYNKFDLFFKRYNGVRIDAAWQYINPLICKPLKNHDGSDKFDEQGNKLGSKLDHQPQIWDNGKYIIKNIIMRAADNNNVSRDKIFLELLGGNSYDSLDAVKDTGATLIHITRYGHKGWGNVKYFETHKEGSKYQNMRPGDYIIGPGTHDNESLIEQAEMELNDHKRGYLAHNLKLNPQYLKTKENLTKAMTAELYTTKNQFMTLPDMIGSRRRINTPNTTEGNWSYRLNNDYERRYHQNLAQNKGLNYPDALAKALHAKNGPQHLIDKLKSFANILKQDGPMTTQDSDSLL